MLRILGKAASINVRKVLWTCAEIAIPYHREDWGKGFQSTKDPSFLALNPNGLVPVVIDGDFVLWESNAICRYLAGKHQRADLLPTDPQARANVEKWMDWQATDFNNSWRYAFMGLLRDSPAHQDPQLIKESLIEWARHVALLERQLETTAAAFVTGDVFTLADVVLGLSVHRWMMTPADKPSFPAVAAYYDRLCGRPAFMKHGANGHA